MPKAVMPELVVVSGYVSGRVALPEGRELIIGRSELADIRIDHATVSDRHAMVRLEGDRCAVEDLGSIEGTFVNGRALESRGVCHDGGLLHVGEVCLHFRCDPSLEPPLVVDGRPGGLIEPRVGELTIGRVAWCDVILPGQGVQRVHAKLVGDATGTSLVAASADADCRVNGRPFESHRLLFGDQVELGGFRLDYDGRVLRSAVGEPGAALSAAGVGVDVGGRSILNDVSLDVRPGEFVGIIGPSGAGKSTLLRALNGLRAISRGVVFLDGNLLHTDLDRLRGLIGWVPQENIVHTDLTVRQALTFGGRLRLPRDVRRPVLADIVERTAERLGIFERLDVRINRLSGGEAKRVSVGVEMLCRPHILYLDEPTTGLDPNGEGRLMQSLRDLANAGCTVVCTTHVMQHVYLFDRLVVMSSGRVIFVGQVEEARAYFGVTEIAEIFSKLESSSIGEWERKPSGDGVVEPSVPTERRGPPASGRRVIFQSPVLLQRQAALLCSDWRNFLILFGQPVLIGALIAWAVVGTSDDSALKLFFASIATLWFGCSNGAQEIVGELAIYRRERLIGLKPRAYVFSKWLATGVVTWIQAALVYAIVCFGGTGMAGDYAWQAAGLGVMAMVAAAFGLALSAAARSAMHAVMLVPLFIIPQIILSGYTVPVSNMSPQVRMVSQFMPSFQLQRVMDSSLLWDREIEAKVLEAHMQAFRNVNAFDPLKLGMTFRNAALPGEALGMLGIWLLVAGLATLVMVRFRERTP